MKNSLKDRGSTLWIVSLVAIMCLGIIGGCAPDDNDINGYYKYGKTIYKNPASSYMVTKHNADNYLIADDSVTIVHADGSEEKIIASFDKSEVNEEDFVALFQPKAGVPDISVFEQRYQYSINEQYCLYVMDDEVWLAQYPGGTMWSIYRLVKAEDD
ncbi:MAG: hypothetical protein ACLFVK_01410 [Dehalococcoidia bacterium]